VRLGRAPTDIVRDALSDAWRNRAPKRVIAGAKDA
jgi:hypothetical protein